MTAVFVRDTVAPTAPGRPTVRSRKRTSLTISWPAATDNVKVTGYRVYVNGAPAGETQRTEYTLQMLECGRAYTIAIDALDALENRSPRASAILQTAPCALAGRLAGVGVGRVSGARIVIATVRVNRKTTAQLRLLRNGQTVVSSRYRVKPGTNKLRLRIPKRIQGGSYRLATTLVKPEGGTLVLARRGVLLPGP